MAVFNQLMMKWLILVLYKIFNVQNSSYILHLAKQFHRRFINVCIQLIMCYLMSCLCQHQNYYFLIDPMPLVSMQNLTCGALYRKFAAIWFDSLSVHPSKINNFSLDLLLVELQPDFFFLRELNHQPRLLTFRDSFTLLPQNLTTIKVSVSHLLIQQWSNSHERQSTPNYCNVL